MIGTGYRRDVAFALISGHRHRHAWGDGRVHHNIRDAVVAVDDVGEVRMQMAPVSALMMAAELGSIEAEAMLVFQAFEEGKGT